MNLTRSSPQVDAERLAGDLRRRICGEVRFDRGSRALYATAAGNYRYVPIGVVIPKDTEDVVNTVAACRRCDAPILARGGGTGLAGQTANVAVVIDFSKYMTRILELDPDRGVARVEPGVVLDSLRDEAEKHHLTFGPDPSTHKYCTLGGMVGNNSCGVHSIMAGRTSDNVHELEILTYDGTQMHVGKIEGTNALERVIAAGGRQGKVYAALRDLRDRYAGDIRTRYPDIPRRVSGYNLDELIEDDSFHVARALVGTEGTCALVLEATLRLVPSPPVRSLVVLGYSDVYSAADHVPEILAHRPIGLEGIDDRLVGYMRTKGLHPQDIELLPDGGGWLLVEFGGDSKDEADDKAHRLMDDLEANGRAPSMKLFDDPQQEHMVWEIRESGLGATAFVPGERPAWEGWEDSAVPPARMGDYLRDFRHLLDSYGYACSLYGHFGEGCLHTRIDFDLKTADGIKKYRSFVEEAADLVVSYGGSLSGEHGDGQSRAELLPKMFGDELVAAFAEFKAIWDPGNKMNPHKVVDPHRLDENLRLGSDYRPPVLATHFQFVHEGGNFADAAARCVGVGKCRKHSAGTMCPSYMVTREEKHSTRGRARLLFEMLEGDPLKRGWREDAVHDALELCLACKGCKRECPVEVDMATYKAEFYSHYYKRRLRPRAAYALGLIYWWARIASHFPRVANFVTHSRPLATLAKSLAGIAPDREFPAFAFQTFRHWFDNRERPRRDGDRVLLWPDTFNNYFHPEVAKAAVAVLESAGARVDIPRRILCCGRPLYDYGMLSTAKMLLRQMLRELRSDIAAGTPIVGLEPSCVAVFRDELVNLFPHDEDARRLRGQVFTLGEFLARRHDYEPPKLQRKALVHGHCHHKAVMGVDHEEKVLQATGVDYEMLDSGCCGMAGSFGFEKDKYDVSMAVGERALLPAVRAADGDTLIVSDGFSCREQISQATPRTALHLAQLLDLANSGGPAGTAPGTPSRAGSQRRAARATVSVGIGTLAAAAGALVRRRRRSR